MNDPPVRLDYHELEHGGRAAQLVLNRPTELNALDWPMVLAVRQSLRELNVDESIRVVLLTGEGRAFSAGGDLKKYRDLQRDAIEFPRFLEDFHELVRLPRAMRAPVIALVNGVTAAGGLELLCACDLAIAARSAKIGDCHLNYGQMGGGGVLTLLPRVVGIQRAMQLVLSGDLLEADAAAAIGLVSQVVDDDGLLDAGLAFAEQIAAKSSLAVANAKSVMNANWSRMIDLEGGMRYELARNAYYCLTASDVREGLAAFVEKRQPRFTGR